MKKKKTKCVENGHSKLETTRKIKKKHGLQQGQLEYNLSFLIVKK